MSSIFVLILFLNYVIYIQCVTYICSSNNSGESISLNIYGPNYVKVKYPLSDNKIVPVPISPTFIEKNEVLNTKYILDRRWEALPPFKSKNFTQVSSELRFSVLLANSNTQMFVRCGNKNFTIHISNEYDYKAKCTFPAGKFWIHFQVNFQISSKHNDTCILDCQGKNVEITTKKDGSLWKQHNYIYYNLSLSWVLEDQTTFSKDFKDKQNCYTWYAVTYLPNQTVAEWEYHQESLDLFNKKKIVYHGAANRFFGNYSIGACDDVRVAKYSTGRNLEVVKCELVNKKKFFIDTQEPYVNQCNLSPTNYCDHIKCIICCNGKCYTYLIGHEMSNIMFYSVICLIGSLVVFLISLYINRGKIIKLCKKCKNNKEENCNEPYPKNLYEEISYERTITNNLYAK